jgi:hypothetical protein
MADKIKRCSNCLQDNSPDEVLCQKCGVMLPLQTIPADTPKPPPPKPAPKPEEKAKAGPIKSLLTPPFETAPPAPHPAMPPAQAPARPWPYEPVPIVTDHQPLRVKVVDLDISMGNLVMLMVKIALAAVPALIILTFILYFLLRLLGVFGLVFIPFLNH